MMQHCSGVPALHYVTQQHMHGDYGQHLAPPARPYLLSLSLQGFAVQGQACAYVRDQKCKCCMFAL
jgi:hypothetical protein